MEEKAIYAELGRITKNREQWKEHIGFTARFLTGQSPRIAGKALWLLGEMGLVYPGEIQPHTEKISAFLQAEDAFLRQRACNALGRIGRADHTLIKPYLEKMLSLAADTAPEVRLSFIWASENIATNAPALYEDYIYIFEKLLADENTRVRMEAPEMFRVLGKRRPACVRRCLDRLQALAEQDTDRVVRIHAKGAVQAISSHS